MPLAPTSAAPLAHGAERPIIHVEHAGPGSGPGVPGQPSEQLGRLDFYPASDLQEIVRWQMRKTAPFPVDQAALSISPGARSADGSSEFVVALSRNDVIQQYEQACLMAGACGMRWAKMRSRLPWGSWR